MTDETKKKIEEAAIKRGQDAYDPLMFAYDPRFCILLKSEAYRAFNSGSEFGYSLGVEDEKKKAQVLVEEIKLAMRYYFDCGKKCRCCRNTIQIDFDVTKAITKYESDGRGEA